jgi:hypothetical protein
MVYQHEETHAEKRNLVVGFLGVVLFVGADEAANDRSGESDDGSRNGQRTASSQIARVTLVLFSVKSAVDSGKEDVYEIARVASEWWRGNCTNASLGRVWA